jgi:hypothetical protein
MLKDRESGQSIIIITMAVIVLLGLVALVVDVGNAYAHRRMVQNAVDAAAMAGARRLAERGIGEVVLEIHVLNDIHDYAKKNGLDPNAVDAWFIDVDGDRLETIDPWLGPAPADADGVEVSGDLPFQTYFAHLFGFPTMTATTVAKAWVLYGPCSSENLFPLTVSTGVFTDTTGGPEIGEVYTLWHHDDKLGPGGWGFIRWVDQDGANHCPDPDNCNQQGGTNTTLRPNIGDTSRSGIWAVGDWVKSDSGGNLPALSDAMAPYIPPAPNEPWPEVTIPLYDLTRGQGANLEFRIAGFAAFKLRCVYEGRNPKSWLEREPGDCAPCAASGTSSTKCITGEFVRKVQPSGQDGCLDTGISIPSFRKPQ